MVGGNQYYYAFGGNRGSAFSDITTKRFTGQYHEGVLPGGEGLSYYNARWYDAQLGRFVSADTIVPGAGNPQAFNRYTYVLNSPTTWVNPSGYSTQRTLLTPEQAAIVVALMVSVPAAVTLGGIGIGLILLTLVLRCGVDENCRSTTQSANRLIRQLGPDGVNTVKWTMLGLAPAPSAPPPPPKHHAHNTQSTNANSCASRCRW